MSEAGVPQPLAPPLCSPALHSHVSSELPDKVKEAAVAVPLYVQGKVVCVEALALQPGGMLRIRAPHDPEVEGAAESSEDRHAQGLVQVPFVRQQHLQANRTVSVYNSITNPGLEHEAV
jgi:hypothetical protein